MKLDRLYAFGFSMVDTAMVYLPHHDIVGSNLKERAHKCRAMLVPRSCSYVCECEALYDIQKADKSSFLRSKCFSEHQYKYNGMPVVVERREQGFSELLDHYKGVLPCKRGTKTSP